MEQRKNSEILDDVNTHTGNFEKKRKIKNISMLVLIILALLCVAVIVINPKTRETILNSINGNIENANESNAVVSSAAIISTKTGTGPFDSNDEPGNDSSEDNNIVRSFDQVTWTVDLTMNSKDNKAIAGSKINVEATLPENCANVMEWDLDSMQWIENGKVSSDGRTLTGSYTVADTETSSSAKQTLVFVLQVYGAGNGTEIIPTFNFSIEGNEDTEKATTTAETVRVSAAGKYNIKLVKNTTAKRAINLDYNGESINGRVYGYTFILQLYNDNSSKGLKGLEYPDGEITFDLDFQLQRNKFDSGELEDITEDNILFWNYKVGYGNEVIPNRSMAFNDEHWLEDGRSVSPYGVRVNDRTRCVYNSGNITMEQNENRLTVTVKDYDFDGIFPIYNTDTLSTSAVNYTSNIGCFSVGTFQVIVPDNEDTTVDNRNYYLTVSDSNFSAETMSGQITSNQMVTSDDSNRVQHVRYSSGSFNHETWLYNGSGSYIHTNWNSGDAKANIGQEFNLGTTISISNSNDPDDYIRSADKFIKFDGEAFEVLDYNGNEKFHMTGTSSMKWKYWYVTKKDGSNWTNQTDMNNGKIEDMLLYENKEDIPEGFNCIGVYIESQEGYLTAGTKVYFYVKLKVI